MNDSQKHALLKVAKDIVEAVIKHKPLPKIEADDPELSVHCGCFVTLKNIARHAGGGEKLRGCIGRFIADCPLVDTVIEMAKASATGDPRFFSDPITPDELPELHIEISVLSPLKKTTDPLSLRLGIDGIYIKRGNATGCFLPQVAEETGWSKEEFLSYCCSHKAGLSAEAWRDPKTEVFFFTAEVFGGAYKDI